MPKFNVSQRVTMNTPNTTNLAGGTAFTLSDREQLVGGICASFAADAYYEKWMDRDKRLLPLVKRMPVLAAITACFARRIMNMRSISHWALANAVMTEGIKEKNGLTREVVNRTVLRPDDITEIAAIIGRKMSNGVKNGLADALERFPEHVLAKYARFGRDYEWNLNDVCRLVHAGRKGKGEVIAKLVKRELVNTDTWEAKLSAAGQKEKEGDAAAKKQAWFDMLTPIPNGSEEGRIKMGYMALLRNVRNVTEQQDTRLTALLKQALLNEKAIKYSRVLPFRFLSALKAIEHDSLARDVHGTIAKAMDIALEFSKNEKDNIFSGHNAVLIDGSGSMDAALTVNKGRRSDMQRNDVACLFGAMLCSGPAIPIIYSNTAFRPQLTSIGLYNTYQSLRQMLPNGGTNLGAAIQLLQNAVHALQVKLNTFKLDRIIVITDEEGWQQHPDVTWFNGPIWIFNLAGYGTSEFHEMRRRTVYGFSEKVFHIMPQLEKGGLADFIENWWNEGCPNIGESDDAQN